MSAYVVHPRTIDMMLTVARDIDVVQALRRAYPYQDMAQIGNAQEATDARSMLGRYLLCMNIRSVQYRYQGEMVGHQYDIKTGTAYSPMPEYEFRQVQLRHGGGYAGDPSMHLEDARRAFGAVGCYEYQSCELPEFADSPAAWFVNALRHTLGSAVAVGWEMSDVSEFDVA